MIEVTLAPVTSVSATLSAPSGSLSLYGSPALEALLTPVFVLTSGGTIGLTGFEHVQSSASTSWVINHNLGRRVDTEVFTTGGQKIIAEVLNVTNNQVIVTLDTAAAGYAVIN